LIKIDLRNGWNYIFYYRNERINEFQIDVVKIINDIKNININDLTKMELYVIDPDGKTIQFADKYLIGVNGIFDIYSGNELSSDRNKLEEIVKEIDDLV